MTRVWQFLVVGWFCCSAHAYDLYPPGCVTVPELQTLVYGRNTVKFFDGQVALVNARTGQDTINARVTAYRVACAEPNRSAIWLEFSRANRSDRLQMPVVGLGFPYITRLGRLSREPGVFTESEPGVQVLGDPDEDRWIYIVGQDVASAWWDGPIPAEAYNGRFELKLFHAGNINRAVLSIPVPATAELFSTPAPMPLNGRLSGIWVAENAADQGLVLSFSELVPGQTQEPQQLWKQELMVFLSWSTFDSDGAPLWLTGAGRYLPGDTQVAFELVTVTGGQFLASAEATRTVAGSVELTAVSCNRIDLDFNLDPIGLGASSLELKRLYSLEIAGFACRDLEAKLEEIGS